MGAKEGLMRTKFKGARSREGNFTGQKSAKSERIESIYLGKYRY